MQSTKLPRNVLITMIMIFIFGYVGMAISDDRIIENPYTVKINCIIFRNDVAESILLRIKNECNCISIRVYDNVSKNYILLSNIKEGLDVNYEGSELLSILSEMYKEYLDSAKNVVGNNHPTVDTTRISREVFINKRLVKINIDISNQDSSINHFMLYPKG